MRNIKKHFPELEEHVALGPLTTFRIGGEARYLYRVTDHQRLAELLYFVRTHRIPYFFLGGGSCVLISSDTFPGVVFLFKNNKIRVEGNNIIAEAGVAWNQVIITAYKHGLTGLEEMIGIPGTVGGAVVGNVGIPHHEVKNVLTSCTIIDYLCEVKTLSNRGCKFQYRNSRMKRRKEVVLEATFTLKPGDQKEIMEKMNRYRKQRAEKHPHDPSAGSYFKNPFPEKPAGLLIDQCGAKGMCVGDACVSEKHANFLINKGNATSGDMRKLAKKLKKMVKKKFNITLEEEVRYIHHDPVTAFLAENIITRYFFAAGLMLLGLSGIILPILPGWIFIFMAIEVLAPMQGWKLINKLLTFTKLKEIWDKSHK